MSKEVGFYLFKIDGKSYASVMIDDTYEIAIAERGETYKFITIKNKLWMSIIEEAQDLIHDVIFYSCKRKHGIDRDWIIYEATRKE